MNQFASYASECHDALLNGDHISVAQLFNLNFQCRRQLYGDEVIGKATLKIIEIANQYGHAAKLPGSGGCVIGMPFEESRPVEELRRELQKQGFIFCPLIFDAYD